jgi:hypothetical protein
MKCCDESGVVDMLVIPAIGRLRQDKCELEVSLDYIARAHLQKKKKVS